MRASARTGEPDPPLTLSGNAMKSDQNGSLSKFFRFSTMYLVAKQGVVCRVLFRAEGVDG
jgi:hypothetical protein